MKKIKDEVISDAALVKLRAGIESAKRGEIKSLGSFAKYADDLIEDESIGTNPLYRPHPEEMSSICPEDTKPAVSPVFPARRRIVSPGQRSTGK